MVGALLMGTLGNGIAMFIERVILLLASVRGMGILAVICTLGCCRVFKSVRLCLYLRLCCINYLLEVLRGRRVSVFACHALDSFDAISQCVHHFAGVCDGGIGDAFVLELHGVGQAFALGVFFFGNYVCGSVLVM